MRELSRGVGEGALAHPQVCRIDFKPTRHHGSNENQHAQINPQKHNRSLMLHRYVRTCIKADYMDHYSILLHPH